jgi:hypothetical protein
MTKNKLLRDLPDQCQCNVFEYLHNGCDRESRQLLSDATIESDISHRVEKLLLIEKIVISVNTKNTTSKESAR